MNARSSARGFTLIEGMVVAVLFGVLALLMVPIITLHGREIGQGTAMLNLQMQADNISSQLGRDIRKADAVLGPNDGGWLSTLNLSLVTVSAIRIYDTLGNLISAYKIDNNIVKQSADNVTFTPFTTGFGNATVTSGGGFVLSTNRKQVTIQLPLTCTYKSTAYSLPSRNETFRCRN